jgi:hypothetical protein
LTLRAPFGAAMMIVGWFIIVLINYKQACTGGLPVNPSGKNQYYSSATFDQNKLHWQITDLDHDASISGI